MKLTVFGMGYVGSVTAACLANQGHEVNGVDLDAKKVAVINGGRSPIVEPGLEPLLQRGVKSGRLHASTEANELGDVSLICVGTPSDENGTLGLEQVRRVAAAIGEILRNTNNYHVVTVRSTVLPGTTETVILPLLEEHSGKRCGPDFGLCANPEFMREATAVEDFRNPAFTIIGSRDDRSAQRIEELYSGVKAPVERTAIREAEMIKYACNAFHALKVCFANEIGNLSKSLGVDSYRVMELICRDTKLNLSPAYLKPGFAFGGSCLPKDLRALLAAARQQALEMPMLSSLLASNRRQVDRALDLIRQTGKEKIGVLGLTFKAGTDDLRESPVVLLVQTLIAKGYKVRVYDDEVSLVNILGANQRYIESAIPNIASLLVGSIEELLQSSETMVVSKKNPAFKKQLSSLLKDQMIIDLVRLFPDAAERPSKYEGICW